MMWDLRGGGSNSSQQPVRMPSPSFPVPHHLSAPAGSPSYQQMAGVPQHFSAPAGSPSYHQMPGLAHSYSGGPAPYTQPSENYYSAPPVIQRHSTPANNYYSAPRVQRQPTPTGHYPSDPPVLLRDPTPNNVYHSTSHVIQQPGTQNDNHHSASRAINLPYDSAVGVHVPNYSHRHRRSSPSHKRRLHRAHSQPIIPASIPVPFVFPPPMRPSVTNASPTHHQRSASHQVQFAVKLPKSHHRHHEKKPVQIATVNVVPPDFNSNFQYSRCTGRKKALCIGINYKGQENELRGCINDARRVRDFLIRYQGYRKSDILLLTEESTDRRLIPTRENILSAMRWLVRSARADDSLFFHYSGHGGQTPDLDGDELDGFDEVIYPVDYKTSNHIVDDEMHYIMVKNLPRGCRLTALFDSCHSGTVLDLPYIYSSHGRLKGTYVRTLRLADRSTKADVISWSACKDDETSADTFHDGVAVGAMSHAFISSLTRKEHQTYQELLRSIRLILAPRFSQKPQLGSSHHIDTTLGFVM